MIEHQSRKVQFAIVIFIEFLIESDSILKKQALSFIGECAPRLVNMLKAGYRSLHENGESLDTRLHCMACSCILKACMVLVPQSSGLVVDLDTPMPEAEVVVCNVLAEFISLQIQVCILNQVLCECTRC